MLWYKAWLECRFRLILSAFMLFWFTVSAWLNSLKGSPSTKRIFAGLGTATRSEDYLVFTTLVLGLTMSALILAGSGINAQTNWGMAQGLHPSTQFTLSLPVTRARLLWTRAGLGWLLLAGLAVACLLLIQAVTSASLTLLSLPLVLLSATAFYALALWLSTFLDEMWSGMISLALAGALAGYSLAGGPGWINSFAFLQGKAVSWQAIAFYLTLTAAMVWGAWFNIRRKEY